MNATTEVQPGAKVFTVTGQFVHIARNATKTRCGKVILRAAATVTADCRVCNGTAKFYR